MLLRVVQLGILPDQHNILKTVLDILIAFRRDLLLHRAQVHRPGYYCRVIEQVVGFPVDRLSECYRVVRVEDSADQLLELGLLVAAHQGAGHEGHLFLGLGHFLVFQLLARTGI